MYLRYTCYTTILKQQTHQNKFQTNPFICFYHFLKIINDSSTEDTWDTYTQGCSQYQGII
jgi:hypothetical protein